MEVSNFNEEFEVNENNELSLKINDYEEQNIPNPKYYLTNNTYLLYIMSSNNTSNEYESLESSNMDCEEKFAFYEKKDNSNLYQMNLNIDLNEENYVENVRKSEKRRKKIKIINRINNTLCFSKIVKSTEIEKYFNNFLNQKRCYKI
jgi:hypothetical protein